MHVHENDIKRLFLQRRERLASIRHGHDGMATLFKQAGHELLIYGVVFRYQNSQETSGGGAIRRDKVSIGRRLSGRHLAQLKLRRERKSAANSCIAFHPNFPAGELYQMAADGETEACSAELARVRAVGLREGLKDDRLLVLGNSNPRVGNGKKENRFVIHQAVHDHLDNNFSVGSELDSISDKVDQDLAQSARIPYQQIGRFGSDPNLEVQTLLGSAQGECAERMVEQIAQREVDALEVEFAGL